MPHRQLVSQSKSFLSPDVQVKDQLNAQNYARHIDTEIEKDQIESSMLTTSNPDFDFVRSPSKVVFLNENTNLVDKGSKK